MQINMLDSNIIILLKYIVWFLLIPIFIGILLIWAFLKNRLSWLILYILSWFVWLFYLSFMLFNLNFLNYNIYPTNFLVVVILAISMFVISFFFDNHFSFKILLSTLKLNFNIKSIVINFKQLNLTKKVFTLFLGIYSILFLVISFIFVINLPSFADDTFWNWNKPSINMYYDNWLKIIWEKNEILWKWRLGYPIYMPLYKSFVALFSWTWDDIYINLLNWLFFFFWILFIVNITYKETKDIFLTSLSVFLVLSLPLVFYHSVSGYWDLPSAIVSIVIIYLLYKFLEEQNTSLLLLAMFLAIWLSYIKNDWFVIYMPWIVFSFLFISFFQKSLKRYIKLLFDKAFLFKFFMIIILFFIPFLAIKKYYWLWFNQAAWVKSGIWLEWPHWEIFKVFPSIFLNEWNYNIILLWLLLVIYFTYKLYKAKNYKMLIFILAPLFIFILFVLAFLITGNYKWVLNQTTVNRVFTMVFVILLSFFWIIYHEIKRNNQ